MSDVVPRIRESVPTPSARTVLTAPARRQTYGNLLYLILSFPLGLGYAVFVSVGLSLSLGLSVLLVGVVLLAAVLLVTMGVVTVERWLARVLLGVDIDQPGWRVAGRDGPLDGAMRLVLDPAVWLGLLFLVTKLAVGVAALVLVTTLLAPTLALVATPLYYDTPGVRVGLFLPSALTRELSLYVPWNELLVGVSFVARVTSWQVTTLADALAMSALGLVTLVLALNVLNAAAWLAGRWTRLLLGASVADRLG